MSQLIIIEKPEEGYKTSDEEWERFVKEAMTDDGSTNFNLPFNKLTRFYGKAYKEYISLAYLAKDTLSNDDFCRLNHLPDNLLVKWTSVKATSGCETTNG